MQASPSPDGGLGVLIHLTETPSDTIAMSRTERRKQAYGFLANCQMPLRKEQHGHPQGRQTGRRTEWADSLESSRLAPVAWRLGSAMVAHECEVTTASSRTSIDKQYRHAHE